MKPGCSRPRGKLAPFQLIELYLLPLARDAMTA